MIYFTILLLWSIYIFIKENETGNHISKAPYIILLCMFVLCAFRGPTVCVDTQHYIDLLHSYNMGEKFGWFYGLLQKISNQVNSQQLFFIVTASLTYYPLYYITKKESPIPIVSVLVFMVGGGLFLETFNLVRQSIAIQFVLLAMYFIKQVKYKYTVLSLFLAFSFHKIILLTIPFLFLHKCYLNKKITFSILTASVIVGLSGTMEYVSEMLMYLNTVSNSSETGTFAQQFGSYANSGEYIGQWGIMGKLVNMIPMTLMCIVCHRSKEYNSIYYNMMLFGTILLNVFIDSSFCMRFSTILSISSVIAIPIALKNSNSKQSIYIYVALAVSIIVYLRVLIGYYTDPNSLGVIPYHFCFE